MSRMTVTGRFKMYTAWFVVTYIAVQVPYLVDEKMYTCCFLSATVSDNFVSTCFIVRYLYVCLRSTLLPHTLPILLVSVTNL
jgi:hypothetical protein